MHRLDQVLSSMSENGEGKEDVGIKGKHYDGDVTPVSPSPLHYTSLQYASDPPQAMESRMPDAGNPPAYDGPQVRLTMPAYQAMMKEMDNLKAEIARLAQDKIARFTDTLGIEKDLISKDVMDKLVSERDETIRRLQMELANLNRLRASSKSMLDDKPALRKIIEARDHEIDELKDRVSRGATKIDELLRAKQEAAAAASKNQELAVELANTKMTIRTMASDLEAEQNQVRLVTDQLNALRLRDNGPTIESLQQELKDKTTKMNRYRNDANAFKKQLQSKDLLCNKLTSDRTALKGAVVLVEPLATTKFTRTILACKECYVKNLSCDNGAKCQNCIDNGSRCVRWRCAQHHVLKACPDLPFCSVGHNEHGWLISEQERPRW
jgi:peptidoglycan hydrolase-like protein with peptidoglycan-binding domain